MTSLLFCAAAATIFWYVYFNTLWMFGSMALGIASKCAHVV